MIDARVEAVVVIPLRRRRDKVLKRHIAIWKWIKRSNRTTHGIDKERRNHTAVERLAGKRVSWNTKKTLREIALAFRHSRNIGDARDSLAGACAFVIGKEERAIAHDRSANRAAKLVANVFRFPLARRRKEVARIERGVAMKTKHRTVNVV